jgi:hypothetical protein
VQPPGYPVIEFHQFNSPTSDDKLLLFCAPAKAIANWAGIPQKGWHMRMLYQRWVSPTREGQLINFWNVASEPREDQPKKYILGPTALTIALHDAPVIENGCISLDYDSVLPSGLTEAEALKTVAAIAKDRISKRLSPSQIEKLLLFEEDPCGDLIDVEHDYVFEGVLQLAQMVADPDWFIDEHSLDLEMQRDLISALEAMCRPALVVDGQHRLFGAARCDRQVLLPVVAIPDCPWPEQIYQFVVINEKAQRVETSLLTDIFGSSLTKKEQTGLRNQLERSNVSIEDRIAAVIASRSVDSPFFNMVKVKLEGPPPEGANPFIPESAIRLMIDGGGRMARGWRNDDEFYEWYIKPTFPERSQWDNWTDGKWRAYWFRFWQTVGEFYNQESSQELWCRTQQSNLTKAVTLRLFQRLFMEQAISRMKRMEDNLTDLIELLGDEELAREKVEQKMAERSIPSDLNAFADSVRDWFLSHGVPVRFFTYPWKGSLDDAQGQSDLWTEMEKAFEVSQDPKKRYRATNTDVFAVGGNNN